MCLTKITKRLRRRDDQIRMVYHLFAIVRKERQALFSHGGRVYRYKTDVIHVAQTPQGKRPTPRKMPYTRKKYVPYFHSFINEVEALGYSSDIMLWNLNNKYHYELRRVRAYENTIEGVEGNKFPRSVLIHRKMYIPKGRKYIVRSV